AVCNGVGSTPVNGPRRYDRDRLVHPAAKSSRSVRASRRVNGMLEPRRIKTERGSGHASVQREPQREANQRGRERPALQSLRKPAFEVSAGAPLSGSVNTGERKI